MVEQILQLLGQFLGLLRGALPVEIIRGLVVVLCFGSAKESEDASVRSGAAKRVNRRGWRSGSGGWCGRRDAGDVRRCGWDLRRRVLRWSRI